MRGGIQESQKGRETEMQLSILQILQCTPIYCLAYLGTFTYLLAYIHMRVWLGEIPLRMRKDICWSLYVEIWHTIEDKHALRLENFLAAAGFILFILSKCLAKFKNKPWNHRWALIEKQPKYLLASGAKRILHKSVEGSTLQRDRYNAWLIVFNLLYFDTFVIACKYLVFVSLIGEHFFFTESKLNSDETFLIKPPPPLLLPSWRFFLRVVMLLSQCVHSLALSLSQSDERCT